MARKLRSYRLEESLIVEIDAYAKARKVSATQVVEAGVRALLDLAAGGVPDLPAPAAGARVVVSPPSRASQVDLRSQYAAERQRKLNEAKYRRAK